MNRDENISKAFNQTKMAFTDVKLSGLILAIFAYFSYQSSFEDWRLRVVTSYLMLFMIRTFMIRFTYFKDFRETIDKFDDIHWKLFATEETFKEAKRMFNNAIIAITMTYCLFVLNQAFFDNFLVFNEKISVLFIMLYGLQALSSHQIKNYLLNLKETIIKNKEKGRSTV